MIDRLAEDHKHAKMLEKAMNEIEDVHVKPVDTNLVITDISKKNITSYELSKKLEIPIPKYTTEGIRITINLKVSSNWPNGNYVRFSAGYLHKTNGWTWTGILNTMNPAATYSTYTDVTLDIPNSSLPTEQLNHIKIGIDIQNPYSHEHKLYIKTIEATLV